MTYRTLTPLPNDVPALRLKAADIDLPDFTILDVLSDEEFRLIVGLGKDVSPSFGT
jgi:hypothetical protein